MEKKTKPHCGWRNDFIDPTGGLKWAWVACPKCNYPPYCIDMKHRDEQGEHYRCPWCGTRYTVSYAYDDEDEEADR